MASGNPSSKRKSSSSHKKKLSKKSSEVGKRKSRSRKRDKSKKLRRRDVSVSCSDDDSRTENSVSNSSSDSEDDYKHRKVRSRNRGDVKGSKKKVRRSSSIRDDSGGSPISRKRKGSKQNDGSKVKKKSRRGKSQKEGSRKEASVDYTSGDSRSCSTCRGGGSSGESDIERSRGRSKGRQKDKTSNGRDGDRYKYRSRSCTSPFSGDNELSLCPSEDRWMNDNQSRRLRSVLTVPNEYEVEGIYQSKDENKAEIISAYDDCPSCKSNDSYDGGRKKESSHQAHPVLEKKRLVHEEVVEDGRRKESSQQFNVVPEMKMLIHGGKVEDSSRSQINATQFAESKGDVRAQCGKTNRTATRDSEIPVDKSEVSSGIVSSEVGDLELILRQKALENFRKFRGAHQENTIPRDQNGVNKVGVIQSKDKPVKTEPSKETDSRVVGAEKTVVSEMKNVCTTILEGCQYQRDQKVGKDIGAGQPSITKVDPIKTEPSKEPDTRIAGTREIVTSEVNTVSTGTGEGVSIANARQHGVRIPDGNSKQLDPHGTLHADDRAVDTKATDKRHINLGPIRQPNKRSLVYRRDSSGDRSIVKQASQSQDCYDENLQETKTTVKKIALETPKAAVESTASQKIDILGSSGTLGDIRKSNQRSLVYRREVPGDHSQALKTQDCYDGKSQETKSILTKNSPKAAVESSDPRKISISGPSATEPNCCPTPATEVPVSTGPENAATGSSEFEQKTMSVMRGGEMVQVSYKVYIPKKAPALARRQLRR